MTLNDRFTRGLIAGMIAGIASLVWGLLARYVFRISTLLYMDFAAILTFGQKAHGIWENLFAHLIVFLFYGICGVLFAYFISVVSHKNMLLKGAFWGGAIWFASYVSTLLFKVPGLIHIPPKTAASQLLGGLIWGVSMAIALWYMDRKVERAGVM